MKQLLWLKKLPLLNLTSLLTYLSTWVVDPRKSDQVIRGSVVLPKGTGKTTRVAVFTQGAMQMLLKKLVQILSVLKIWLLKSKLVT